MDPIIGIDLGTTNSAVAHLADDGPKLIPNALGQTLTPSVVGIDEDQKVLVGAAAKELQVLHPERCAAMFKRQMGSDWKATLVGRSFTPEELSSLVLGSLRADAESFFGCEVRRAVISVPAYFNDRQRKATVAAGKIAGLQVERILNEPTAAAIAYGFHEASEEKTLLIFDLGGGTFDVSVVEIFEGALEVRSSSGENFLGGEDFTRTMAARLLESRGQPFERAEVAMPHLVSRLIQQCEQAKRKLSREETAQVRFPDARGDFPPDAPVIDIARMQYEKWIEPILARVEMPIRRVLGDAGLDRSGIDEVVLVGGATRTPLVCARVKELFGKPAHQRLNPDEVVAMGTAVQAGLVGNSKSVEDLVVTDVAPFTLGVHVVKELGGTLRDGYFLPIVQRNTTIPVSRVETVSTVFPNQPAVTVKVYQGESRRVDDNLCLGEFEIKGIPPGPAGQPIDLRFTYDLNGILEIEATVQSTGKKVTHIITRHARGLTAEDIRLAVKEMSKLKTHPREDSVNRLLLRRAERLFQELPQYDRDRLSALLDGFEASLNLQDPVAIESNRIALKEFLDDFDRSESPDGS